MDFLLPDSSHVGWWAAAFTSYHESAVLLLDSSNLWLLDSNAAGQQRSLPLLIGYFAAGQQLSLVAGQQRCWAAAFTSYLAAGQQLCFVAGQQRPTCDEIAQQSYM